MKISCAGCERARWDRALPASRVPVPPVRGIAALPWDRLCRVSAPGALPFSSAVPLGWGRCVLCAPGAGSLTYGIRKSYARENRDLRLLSETLAECHTRDG